MKVWDLKDADAPDRHPTKDIFQNGNIRIEFYLDDDNKIWLQNGTVGFFLTGNELSDLAELLEDIMEPTR